MDIQTLILKSRNGDTEAFGTVVTEFRQMVFRLAFRLMCDEEEAKDIVQDTFVKAWVSLGKYDPGYQFSTWIYRIAANLCYDRLRTINRRKTNNALPLSYEDLSARPDTELMNKELKEAIISISEGLTPKQRLVFTLIDIEELDPGEVHEITGLSKSGIKSNLYLARKHIREKFKQ